MTSKFSSRDFNDAPRSSKRKPWGVWMQKFISISSSQFKSSFPMSSPTFQSSPCWFLFSPDSPNCIMDGITGIAEPFSRQTSRILSIRSVVQKILAPSWIKPYPEVRYAVICSKLYEPNPVSFHHLQPELNLPFLPKAEDLKVLFGNHGKHS